MAFKNRTEPRLLKIYRILNYRMELSDDEKQTLFILEKGYEGEVKFDLLTEKLSKKSIIINDLLLEVNDSEFQIDSYLIYQDTIYLFDVKNYQGGYCYGTENFRKKATGKLRKNPIIQLNRSISLFSQLLQENGYDFKFEAYIVFINPEFTLFQAPTDQPIILPTQINALMKKLEAKPSKLSSFHHNFAENLVSQHKTESKNARMPVYSFERLKMGSVCKDCHTSFVTVDGRKLVCNICGCEEKLEAAVLRNVAEIRLLFPDMKITTALVHEWCGVVESKKMISRILEKNFISNGVCKWRYFE